MRVRRAGCKGHTHTTHDLVSRSRAVTGRGAFERILCAVDVSECSMAIEIKASATIEGYAVAQTLNYLKVAGGGVGLLLNFGHKPEFKRLVMGEPSNSLPRLRNNGQPQDSDEQ